ncbi:hypothetical protein [Ursidibacter sp. B-7004-1]
MYEKIIRLRLSAQAALIGRITSDVRGVYVKIDSHNIFLCVVIDKKSSYWEEIIYEIGTAIIADFDSEYTIDEELIILQYSAALDFKGWVCVYKRYE